MEVEPIRDKAEIRSIYNWLKRKGHPREAEAFLIGCNFALRVSDLLRLKIEDVTGDFIELQEKKTKKHKRFPVNETAKKSIQRLIDHYQQSEFSPVYLFQGMGNFVKNGDPKPISSQYLYRMIKRAASELGLEENIGTHTMRKTFAYHAYINGADIHHLQGLLNHKSAETTLHYIGVTRKTVEQIYIDNEIRI